MRKEIAVLSAAAALSTQLAPASRRHPLHPLNLDPPRLKRTLRSLFLIL